MSCEKVKKQLPLYVGNDLSLLSRMRVSMHLVHCTACAAELDKYAAIRQVTTQTLSTLDIEYDDIWHSVLYRLPERKPYSAPSTMAKTRRRFRTVSYVLAGVAVLFIALFVNYRSHEKEEIVDANVQNKASLPVVEYVDKPGVTVMTFKTKDPKMTIVWFFEKETI